MAVDVLTWDAFPPEVEDDTDLNDLVAQVAREVAAAEDEQGVKAALRAAESANVVASVWRHLLEGVWDPTKHPRWPPGMGDKSGEFIRVGQRFLWGGKEYEVANVFTDEIVVVRATGKPSELETKEIKLSPGTKGMTLPGAKLAPIQALKGTTGKGHSSIAESDQTIVDPYVHPETHDPSIPIPAGSKLTPEQWKRFGRIDQLNYQQLMQRFGTWSASKAKTLTNQMLTAGKNEFGQKVVNIVTNAFQAQLGSSTGNTISLTNFFQNLAPGSPGLAQAYKEREQARIVQGEYRAAVQWDLYNRVHGPDVFLDHGDNNGHSPKWWTDNFINGKQPIFPGLSMTHHYRGAWWGPVHINFPMAIRNILMTVFAGGSMTSLGGEKETSVDYQFELKPDKALVFEPNKISTSINKWLMGATEKGASGEIFNQLKDVLAGKESIPLVAAALHISLEGSGGTPKPPPAAAKPSFWQKAPAVGQGTTAATLPKDLPWLNKNSDGTPALADGYKAKIGQYFMGKQGTLYWIGADPSSPNGKSIHKIVNGEFNGESFTFDPSVQGYYLTTVYEPPKPKVAPSVAPFDPDAWLAAGKKVFLQNAKPGEKFFGGDGASYEVTAASPTGVSVLQLGTGKKGTANTDAQVTLLVPKSGYVPPPKEAEMGPQPGMVFGVLGKSYRITSVLKSGVVRAKVKGGGSVKLTPAELPSAQYLHDPSIYDIAPDKKKLMDFGAGEKFTAGTGLQQQRPYMVIGPEGKTKIKVRNLLTGEESILSRQKQYRPLVAKGAVPAPVEEAAPSFNFDSYFPGTADTIKNLPEGTIIVSAKGTPYKLTKKGPKSGAVAENLLTGKPYPAIAYDTKWDVLQPKAGNVVPHEYLAKGDDTTIKTLKVGDQFKPPDSDLTFEVVAPAGEKDQNAVVKPVYSYGYGSETSAHASPGTAVVFQAKAGEGIKPDPTKTVDASELPAASGFVPFKSSHGTGGKWKHEKISLMAAGTVFTDKSGKVWVVKQAGSQPIVSDGEDNYSINGEWRGKAFGQEHTYDPPSWWKDNSPPLGGPTAGGPVAATQFTTNTSGLTLGDLKPGQWYITSAEMTAQVLGPDPDQEGFVKVKMFTPSGNSGVASTTQGYKPKQVDIDAESPTPQTAAPVPSLKPLGVIKEGFQFTHIGGSKTYTVTKVNADDTILVTWTGASAPASYTAQKAASFLDSGTWIPVKEKPAAQQPGFDPVHSFSYYAADYAPAPGEQVWVDAKDGAFLGTLKSANATTLVGKVEHPDGTVKNYDLSLKVFVPWKVGDTVQTPNGTVGKIEGFSFSGGKHIAKLHDADGNDASTYVNQLSAPPAETPATGGVTLPSLDVFGPSSDNVKVGHIVKTPDGYGTVTDVSDEGNVEVENFGGPTKIYSPSLLHNFGNIDQTYVPGGFKRGDKVEFKDPAGTGAEDVLGFEGGTVVGAMPQPGGTPDIMVATDDDKVLAYQPNELTITSLVNVPDLPTEHLSTAPLAPHVELKGYKSAWGSGGKYKHEFVKDLPVGTSFHDKTGTVYEKMLAPPLGVSSGKVTVKNKATGKVVLVDANVRVRKL